MSMSQRHAFTLIEILIVIAIIASLAAVVLGAVSSLRNSSDQLKVNSSISAITAALLLHKTVNNSLPAADASCFLDYDKTLDVQDPLNNTDSVYATWPVLNKLVAHNGLSLDHDLLIDQNGSKQRLFDMWDQEIRYVIGSGIDDQSHTPEGMFDDWNWDTANDQALSPGYPYVYSYGADNPDGSDHGAWIYGVSDQ